MLTRVQLETAGVIAELTAFFGRPPTCREVGAELGLNPGNAHQIASRLRQRGWLKPGRKLVLARAVPPLREDAIAITDAGRAALVAAAAERGSA